ncbi:MAG: hypothetical protein ACOC7S_00830 [Planctomycetota bacterium]
MPEPDGSSATCPHHTGVVAELHSNSKRIEKLEGAYARIEKRPPAWVVVVVSALSAGLSAAVTLVATLLSTG